MGAIVNLKNMTIALIISLAYEMLLKLSHTLIPSLFNISVIPRITSVISFVVGVIIILFLFLFYQEERTNDKVALVLKLLIGCFVLQFILRLPITEKMIDYKMVRLIVALLGFINAILLFVLMIFYKREIPPEENLLNQAAMFITVMFGMNIIKSLYSFISFMRFVFSGITVHYSPIFHYILFVLFLVTHASIIYFLCRYYQFKFTLERFR